MKDRGEKMGERKGKKARESKRERGGKERRGEKIK
jgi:hypothetical protein